MSLFFVLFCCFLFVFIPMSPVIETVILMKFSLNSYMTGVEIEMRFVLGSLNCILTQFMYDYE